MSAPQDEPRGGSVELLRRYDATVGVVDRLSGYVIICTMAVLTAVLSVQVFLRYGLNMSLDWAWDVPRACFIWTILLSIPLGFRHSAHVGVDLVIERLALEPKRLLHRINALLMAGLMVIVAAYAVDLARATWDQMMPGIDISVGWFYVAVVVCGVHSLLHLIRLVWTGTPPIGEIEVT